MNKRNKIIILLYFFISTLCSAKRINSYYYNLIYLKTNKSTYYFDESMKFNASWELNYNVNQEISYIQIQIWDDFDFIIWNSTKFYEIGLNIQNWSLNIQNLNYTFTNSTNKLYIKAFHYVKDITLGIPKFTLLKSVSIDILKRNLSYEIFGFKNELKYGEFLSFKLKFFCIENNVDFSNQPIEFKVISRNIIIFQQILVSNSSGFISIFLSSIEHLKLGQNILIFNISNNAFFGDTYFLFNLKVERYLVLVEIMNFKDKISLGEKIRFNILYYFINSTVNPLINKKISLKIYNNDILTIEKLLITNISGMIEVNFSQNLFETKTYPKKIYISLFFNGSKALQNNSLYLNIDLIEDQNQKNYIFIEITLFSLFGTSISYFSIFLYKKKKSKKKLLKEICFKI